MTQTVALTYNTYVAELAALAAYQIENNAGVNVGVEPTFTLILPQVLQYAELRIQRDAALLPALTSNAYTLASGLNVLAVPVGDFVTIETVQINVDGVYASLNPVSKEFMQAVWPTGSAPGQPRVFAVVGGDISGAASNNVMVGPPPNSNYPVTIFGMQRLPSLYLAATPSEASTVKTFISTWLPDLLLMASMIFVSGYQRNFGRMSDDPTMAMSYETQYQALLKGVTVEEARKRFAAGAWASQPLTPVASPSR